MCFVFPFLLRLMLLVVQLLTHTLDSHNHLYQCLVSRCLAFCRLPCFNNNGVLSDNIDGAPDVFLFSILVHNALSNAKGMFTEDG